MGKADVFIFMGKVITHHGKHNILNYQVKAFGGRMKSSKSAPFSHHPVLTLRAHFRHPTSLPLLPRHAGCLGVIGLTSVLARFSTHTRLLAWPGRALHAPHLPCFTSSPFLIDCVTALNTDTALDVLKESPIPQWPPTVAAVGCRTAKTLTTTVTAARWSRQWDVAAAVAEGTAAD